jgi:hypothetical protein
MNRRSRLAALIAAAGVATALASPAAAVTVTIDHQTLEFAEVDLGDVATRVGDVTSVFLSETFDGIPVLAYDRSNFVAIACDDGSEGLAGTERIGQTANPTVAFDRQRVAFARASATIAVIDSTVNTCDGTATPTGSATLQVAMDLVGSGPVVHDVTNFKSGLPGLFLQRWPELLVFHAGTGSLTVDGVTTAVSAAEGFIGFSRGQNHVIEH